MATEIPLISSFYSLNEKTNYGCMSMFYLQSVHILTLVSSSDSFFLHFGPSYNENNHVWRPNHKRYPLDLQFAL